MSCLLFLAGAFGCSSPDTAREADEEVRRAFWQFQDAIEEDDLDRLWEQLDESFHNTAERAAAEARDAFAKASPKERAALAKELELSEDEAAQVTGVQMLRARHFRTVYEGIPSASVLSIDIDGDLATVWYRAEDGEEEKALFHRDQGRWKASLPIR